MVCVNGNMKLCCQQLLFQTLDVKWNGTYFHGIQESMSKLLCKMTGIQDELSVAP